MGRFALLIAVACTACGRFGFDGATAGDAAPEDVLDGVPDVLLGHDEDADGFADVVDLCPHLGSVQDDADGDQIGDACDPEPANPRQRLVLFATMQPGDQPLALAGGTWTQNPDAVFFDGNGFGSVARTGNLASVRVSVGLDIVSVIGPSLQHQIALGAAPGGPQSYFVELNEIGATSHAAITDENLGTYTQLATDPLVNRMHTGRATLQDTQDAETKITTMDGGWVGEPYSLSASTPSYNGAADVGLGINNLAVEVRYVWIVEW